MHNNNITLEYIIQERKRRLYIPFRPRVTGKIAGRIYFKLVLGTWAFDISISLLELMETLFRKKTGQLPPPPPPSHPT